MQAILQQSTIQMLKQTENIEHSTFNLDLRIERAQLDTTNHAANL
jgi:hypothetical protein